MRRFVAVLLFATLAAAAFAAGSELYGKPLRGLSAVSVATVVAHPADYSAKPIRVSAPNKGEKGHAVLSEGDAALPLETDGFSLPEDLAGARLTAEGRVKSGEKGVVFVATGVEVKR